MISTPVAKPTRRRSMCSCVPRANPCVYVCIAFARVHAPAISHVGVKSRACVGGRSLASRMW